MPTACNEHIQHYNISHCLISSWSSCQYFSQSSCFSFTLSSYSLAYNIEFSKKCDLLLPASTSIIVWISLSSSNSCLLLLSHLLILFSSPLIACFRRQLLWKMWQIQLSFPCFIVRMWFLSSSSVYNTSLVIRSVQLILSILQRNISKLPRYFWYTFRIVQVWAPYKAVLQM
jgi:hypothetical protein